MPLYESPFPKNGACLFTVTTQLKPSPDHRSPTSALPMLASCLPQAPASRSKARTLPLLCCSRDGLPFYTDPWLWMSAGSKVPEGDLEHVVTRLSVAKYLCCQCDVGSSISINKSLIFSEEKKKTSKRFKSYIYRKMSFCLWKLSGLNKLWFI